MSIGGRWFRQAVRYGLAAVFVVLAVLLRWLLEGMFGPLPLFITFYPAVLLTSVVCGFGPGLFATVLSVAVTTYWFVPPYASFSVEGPNDLVALGIFLGCNIVLCVLLNHLHRTRRMEAVRASQEAEVAMLNEGSVLTLLAQTGSGKILLWGRNAESLYGWTVAEAVGRTAGDLMNVRFPVPFEQISQEFAATGQWFGDLVCTTKDGRQMIVESHWVARRNALGRREEFLAFDVDVTARRHAEKAIRESEAKFRKLFDSLPMGVWVIDPETLGFAMFNDAAPRMLGYSREEFACLTVPQIEVDHDLAMIRENLRDAAAGVSGAFETHHQTKTHELRDIWITGDRIEIGGRTLVLAIMADITERKRAEKTVREAEAKFRKLFDSLPMAVWVVDPDTLRFVLFNEAAPRMLGYGREEFATLTLPQIEADKDLAAIRETIGRMLIGEVATFETHYWNKARQRLDIWVLGDVIEIGGKPMVMAIQTDITERKRAEATLARTTQRYRLLSEVTGRLLAAGDPVALVNDLCLQVMRHVDCQAFFASIADPVTRRLRLHAHAGIPEEEARKYRWIDYGMGIAGSVARDRVSVLVEDVPASSDPRTYIIKGWKFLAYVCHPLLAEGQLLGVLSFGTRTRTHFAPDELELIKTVADHVAVAIQRIQSAQALQESEQELRRAVGELERSNRELEQFAYIASHDLQEPLRQVRAFAKRLDERYRDQLDDAAKEYLRFIVDGAARMTALVQDLLTYSRVGVRQPESTLVSSREALEKALDDLRASIQEARARITCDDLPEVVANATQLVQLFQNLLSNAIKFRRDGVSPEIHVGVRAEPQRWVFSVADNGIGIAREHYDRVFQIFQRLHGPDKYPGTGIGLAICRRIVHHHQGEIWIESQAGEGTSFFFTLPRADLCAGEDELAFDSPVSSPPVAQENGS